jgi:EAL domain-containing protein (putative c-di-GMP-specific phosphodiesterase class I)/Tfp pilus assembly protein PilF
VRQPFSGRSGGRLLFARRFTRAPLWESYAAEGVRARERGRYGEAVRRCQAALRAAENGSAPAAARAAVLICLGLAYAELGRYAEAEPVLRQALSIREQDLGPDHPQVANGLSHLAALYAHQGRYADAESLYRRVLAMDEYALGAAHPEVATDLNNLGAVYGYQDRYGEAEPLLRRALWIEEKAYGADHVGVAACLNNLAFLHQRQRRYAEAEALYARALAIRQRLLGVAHAEVAVPLSNLASLFSEQGKHALAEPLYRQALALRCKALGPMHPTVAVSLESCASLFLAMGWVKKADRAAARARAIRTRCAEQSLQARWDASARFADAGDPAVPWPGALGEGFLAPGAGDGETAGLLRADDPSLRAAGVADSLSSLFSEEGRQLLEHPSAPSEADLLQAMERHDLQVYYQPIVSLITGQVVGAEALLRWQHPQRGLMSPVAFVPLAEETGLIFQIGENLLRETCGQNHAWHEAGHEGLRLQVNLTARQLCDPELPQRVRAVLAESGLTAAALQLEIAESIAVHQVEASIAALEALRTTGVHVAIDNFGIDGESLGSLERFPVHAVKIHQSLVRQIDAGEDAVERIRSIIARAHSLAITVIAEGVETEEQLEFLRRQECDEIQGYLFRRAAPAEAFTALLSEGQCLASAVPGQDDRSLAVLLGDETGL